MKKMRIGIFGGAFDPPHVDHANVIRTALNSGMLDEIWVVPAGLRVEKEMEALSKDRLRMCALMLQEEFGDDPRIVLRSEQAENNKASFSIDILRNFRRTYSDYYFCLVVGSDVLRDIPKWKEGETLIERVPFVVVERDGPIDSQVTLPKICVILPRFREKSYSSTLIRKLCKEGRDISIYVNPSVGAYIKKKELYR